ncbi:MAG: FtsX-like permease family protein [Nitrososphaerota archaeon]
MNKLRILPLTVLLIVFLGIFIHGSAIFLRTRAEKGDGSVMYRTLYSIMQKIDLNAVMNHVSYLSSLGSRVTGYPGYEKAGEYIYSKFVEYGLSNVSYHFYNVATPIDYETYVFLPSKGIKLKAYALWPNGIQTSSIDLSGPLVYGGIGNWRDFDGKKINGSIVLLEFNSRDNWLKAAELGARAVIFIEPDDTSASEAQLKKLNYVPLDFPRIYVNKTVAKIIIDELKLQGNLTIRVFSNMKYENILAKNVIGFISGIDPDPAIREQIVVIMSHFDSSSVVPAFSPGASEAIGVAALLELAKFFAENPAPRTLMFIAFSGHGQNLMGARAFMGDIVWFEKNISLASKFVSVLDIDITAEADSSGFMFSFIGNQESNNWYSAYYQDFIKNMTRLWADLYAKTYRIEGYPGMLPVMISPLSINSEGNVFGSCGIFSTIQITSHSWYRYRGTPLDTLDKYDADNIKPQLQVFFLNAYLLVRSLPQKPLQPFSISFARFPQGSTVVQGGGFGLLVGKVVEYDMAKGEYQPVPNSIVLIRSSSGNEFQVTFANGEGIFIYPGARPLARLGYPYFVEAYVINSSTNSIVYAPDYGRYVSSYSNYIQIPMEGYLGTLEHPRPFVVFKAGSLVLYDILATEQLLSTISFYSRELGITSGTISPTIYVNDIETHAPPDHYSWVAEGTVSMVFAASSRRIEVIIKVGSSPLGMLINATREHMEGSGIRLRIGKQLKITHSPLKLANDLLLLNTARLSSANLKGLYTGAEDYHNQATVLLENAKDALSRNEYSLFYAECIGSWSLSKQVYQLVMDNINSSASTASFLFAFLIPFALVFEELFFPNIKMSVKARFLTVVAIFVSILMILIFFHPGFRIASSIYVSLLGLTILTFTLPVTVILISNAERFLREIRVKLIGEHYTGVSKSAAVSLSFSMGISQMKKRTLRTFLVLFSLIVITTSTVMFTSVYPLTIVGKYPKTGQANYAGLYLRDIGYSSLNFWLVDRLASEFGLNANICARAVLYPPSSYIKDGFRLFDSNMHETRVLAVYGLSPEEGGVTGWAEKLVNGSWFSTGSLHVAVLPDSLANTLQAKVGDIVFLEGLPLRVIGILNSSEANRIVDLDQNPATPRDLRIITGIGFFSTSDLIFVPYQLAIDLGGSLYSVVISFKESSHVADAAERLAKETRLAIYAAEKTGVNGNIYYCSIAKGIQSYGYTMLLPPLIISGLVIFNMILRVVFERTREIGILGAVGASPLQIAGIFLGEIVTYAIVSVIIGYVIGIVLLQTLTSMGLFVFEGFFPNYSSIFAAFVISLILLSVMIPSLYPLYKASRIVTPSLERKWKLPTKPVGDNWLIPLPFIFVDESEAHGMLMFLKEYLSTFTLEGFGAPFVTKSIAYRAGDKEKSLSVTMHIAPFPAGIHQKVDVNVKFDPNIKRWTSGLLITRIVGELNMWQKSNYIVIDAIRKQFLQWRGLPESVKNKYKVIKNE